jgi:predicted RNA-binding Zn ribbon-like protein
VLCSLGFGFRALRVALLLAAFEQDVDALSGQGSHEGGVRVHSVAPFSSGAAVLDYHWQHHLTSIAGFVTYQLPMMVSSASRDSNRPRDRVPDELGVVIDFVNTLDVETGVDEIADPAVLSSWLSARGLQDTDAPESRAGLRRTIALREALRSLMLANNGGAVEPGAWAELEQAAARGSLRAHFGADGGARLDADGAGVDAALARLLVPVFNSIRDGSWHRAKACRAADCQWAFYDRSRNRSGVWCDMAVCGNREKVRAFRERSPGRAELRG